MYTLGINAVYHDSAACLVKDGQVMAAAEEERFTHVKHGKRPIPFSTYELPFHAIDYCLREGGISLVDVDHVAYSYDPFLLLDSHRDDSVFMLPLEPSAHAVPVLPSISRQWVEVAACTLCAISISSKCPSASTRSTANQSASCGTTRRATLASVSW